jgi:hypothetical protein
MKPPRAPEPSQLAGLFHGMVLTAELACEEVLGSEADWHPEIRTRTPRSGRENNFFMVKKIQ